MNPQPVIVKNHWAGRLGIWTENFAGKRWVKLEKGTTVLVPESATKVISQKAYEMLKE